MAACMASIALRSPAARPVPMSASPCSAMMVRTSAKSTFTRPPTVMMSLMPCTACRSTSSARLKASGSDEASPATEISRWLGMTMRVSTAALSSASPCSACLRRRLPSKRKGLVTTPTVRAPDCLATSATIGAPPVPVPPPMPAVTKTMSAPASASAMASRDSSAASRPRSGLAPAPRPFATILPSWIFTDDLLAASACTSVLQAMNSTPSMRAATMVLMALPPPPPTPITLMRAPGSSLSVSSIMSVLSLSSWRVLRRSLPANAASCGAPCDTRCRPGS